jgi:hypothetical protein
MMNLQESGSNKKGLWSRMCGLNGRWRDALRYSDVPEQSREGLPSTHIVFVYQHRPTPSRATKCLPFFVQRAQAGRDFRGLAPRRKNGSHHCRIESGPIANGGRWLAVGSSDDCTLGLVWGAFCIGTIGEGTIVTPIESLRRGNWGRDQQAYDENMPGDRFHGHQFISHNSTDPCFMRPAANTYGH